MFASAYDAARLILVVAQSKGLASEADFEATIQRLERLEADAGHQREHVASIIVLAGSDNPPNAQCRKRIATIESGIRRVNIAFVAATKVAMMAATAFNWLAPKRKGLVRTTHATYELARDWQVAQGVHRAANFDVLHDDVLRQFAR